jgi:hypothetical protein
MPHDVARRRFVRERAGNRCEYCHIEQDELPYVTFHVEHVVARQHGGNDEESDLCLSCHWCNFHKGPNIATIVDGQLIPLFNPRLDRWHDHFEVASDKIMGLTAVGRGTVLLLKMNDSDRRELRRASRS